MGQETPSEPGSKFPFLQESRRSTQQQRLRPPLFSRPQLLALFPNPTSLPVTISLLKLNLVFKLKQNHQQVPFLPVTTSGLLYKHLTEDTGAVGTPRAQGKGQNRQQTAKTCPRICTPDLGLGLTSSSFHPIRPVILISLKINPQTLPKHVAETFSGTCRHLLLPLPLNWHSPEGWPWPLPAVASLG